jgi:hypothetical protein
MNESEREREKENQKHAKKRNTHPQPSQAVANKLWLVPQHASPHAIRRPALGAAHAHAADAGEGPPLPFVGGGSRGGGGAAWVRVSVGLRV